MRSLTFPRRLILWLVVVTDICATIATLSSRPVADVIVGLPLALLLPGTALVLAVDPRRRQVQGTQRLMWSVAASIGIVIMGGLVLNLTGGLTRSHWLYFITMVVLVLSVVGWVRGGPHDDDHVGGAAATAPTIELQDVGLQDLDASEPVERRHRVGGLLLVRQGGFLLAAVGVVSGALLLSLHSDASASREHFVQTWILPQPTSDPWSSKAQVGVTNYEGGRERFIVRETIGTSAVQQQTITLAEGQAWNLGVLRKPGEPVTVTVGLSSRPDETVATVSLAQPAGSGRRHR